MTGFPDITIISPTPDFTYRLGMIIGENSRPGDLVALEGELGVGKTHLTKGIAAGLDIGSGTEITSPSYSILNEYPGEIPLYHFDAYRLADAYDLLAIGFEEYLEKKGVIVIEWAERVRKILPDDSTLINMLHLDRDSREIKISAREELLEILKITLEEEEEKDAAGCS